MYLMVGSFRYVEIVSNNSRILGHSDEQILERTAKFNGGYEKMVADPKVGDSLFCATNVPQKACR
jgi:hypothetical protein